MLVTKPVKSATTNLQTAEKIKGWCRNTSGPSHLLRPQVLLRPARQVLRSVSAVTIESPLCPAGCCGTYAFLWLSPFDFICCVLRVIALSLNPMMPTFTARLQSFCVLLLFLLAILLAGLRLSFPPSIRLWILAMIGRIMGKTHTHTLKP